jgi:multidrug efflux pump subunit AcrB
VQPKTKRTIGWVLSIFVSLFLIGPSAMGKFVDWEGKTEMFEKMGLTTDLSMKIGVLEVFLAILFLIPRASFLAAILLTGYLGGAVMTHVRVGEPFFFPIIIGIVMWIALGLRRPEVFALAFGSTDRPPS